MTQSSVSRPRLQRRCKRDPGEPHLWIRSYPNGHVTNAECHKCGVSANAKTVAVLDADFQANQPVLGYGLGGRSL